MKPRIQIPAELRDKIVKLKASLPEQIAAAATAVAEAQSEIDRLQKLAGDLTASLPALSAKSVASQEAAGEVVATQSRIAAVNGQIEKLKAQAAKLPTVTLDEASVVLKEVCRFYYTALDQAIIDAISPFDSRSHLPRQMIAFFDAPRAVNSIGETYLGNTPATPGNIEWLFRILDRALRGQCHLAIDQETESADVASDTQPKSPSQT